MQLYKVLPCVIPVFCLVLLPVSSCPCNYLDSVIFIDHMFVLCLHCNVFIYLKKKSKTTIHTKQTTHNFLRDNFFPTVVYCEFLDVSWARYSLIDMRTHVFLFSFFPIV